MRSHEPTIANQAVPPVPPVQLITGGHPARRRDVRAIPISLRDVEDLLFD
jgi:hypothetical protein